MLITRAFRAALLLFGIVAVACAQDSELEQEEVPSPKALKNLCGGCISRGCYPDASLGLTKLPGYCKKKKCPTEASKCSSVKCKLCHKAACFQTSNQESDKCLKMGCRISNNGSCLPPLCKRCTKAGCYGAKSTSSKCISLGCVGLPCVTDPCKDKEGGGLATCLKKKCMRCQKKKCHEGKNVKNCQTRWGCWLHGGCTNGNPNVKPDESDGNGDRCARCNVCLGKHNSPAKCEDSCEEGCLKPESDDNCKECKDCLSMDGSSIETCGEVCPDGCGQDEGEKDKPNSSLGKCLQCLKSSKDGDDERFSKLGCATITCPTPCEECIFHRCNKNSSEECDVLECDKRVCSSSHGGKESQGGGDRPPQGGDRPPQGGDRPGRD